MIHYKINDDKCTLIIKLYQILFDDNIVIFYYNMFNFKIMIYYKINYDKYIIFLMFN